MDSKEYEGFLEPEVAIIPAGEAARDAYGHRWGSQKLRLTPALVNALENGYQLAVEIDGGEYVLFLSL